MLYGKVPFGSSQRAKNIDGTSLLQYSSAIGFFRIEIRGKAAPSALPPQWDLSSLYTSAEPPSFKKDLASASLQAERLSSLCEGRVADLPPKEYGEMLTAYDKLNVKLDKRNAYAELRYMNETNDANTAFLEKHGTGKRRRL